ncbi:hypothetical protein MACH23_34310 [Sulfitobacter pontiacus]|nr:hypothetical protein MACH23_34310 [Sulfitobacter pontiacus]
MSPIPQAIDLIFLGRIIGEFLSGKEAIDAVFAVRTVSLVAVAWGVRECTEKGTISRECLGSKTCRSARLKPEGASHQRVIGLIGEGP